MSTGSHHRCCFMRCEVSWKVPCARATPVDRVRKRDARKDHVTRQNTREAAACQTVNVRLLRIDMLTVYLMYENRSRPSRTASTGLIQQDAGAAESLMSIRLMPTCLSTPPSYAQLVRKTDNVRPFRRTWYLLLYM